MKIPEALSLTVDLALARGAKSIKDLPGCHEMAVDDHWWIAFNGHADPTACSKGAEVPPYSLYIEWNGWPAGILNAGGGTIAAGTLANEDTYIEAVRKALDGVTMHSREGGG